MKFNLLTYTGYIYFYVTSFYSFLSIVFVHVANHILFFYFCTILYNVTIYSILA